MRAIFLDIDGVLNVISMDCGPRDEFGGQFHKNMVDNLARVIEQTGAVIVISSSWRHSGLSQMQRMWEMRDLPGKVIGVTPSYYRIQELRDAVDNAEHRDFAERAERGHEIQWWLDNHGKGVERYCIIDDDNDMLPHHQPYFVRTCNNQHHTGHVEGYGLTDECAALAIRVLNGGVAGPLC